MLTSNMHLYNENNIVFKRMNKLSMIKKNKENLNLKLPSFKSSMHSKVTSNWKGLKKGEGLSRTTTLHTWTLAI